MSAAQEDRAKRNIPSLLSGQSCRDEAPAVVCSLGHKHTKRQGADYPITIREMAAPRPLTGTKFGHHQSIPLKRLPHITIAARIINIQPTTKNGYGTTNPAQTAKMRLPVNTECKTGHDCNADIGKLCANAPCGFKSKMRTLTRADNGNSGIPEKRSVTRNIKEQWRVFNIPKRLWETRIKPCNDGHARLRCGLVFPFRLFAPDFGGTCLGKLFYSTGLKTSRWPKSSILNSIKHTVITCKKLLPKHRSETRRMPQCETGEKLFCISMQESSIG